jgi:flagellar hook-associated protein 2
MAIKMSGLASSLDTEKIISELMSAQRMKSRKIENNKTKLEWKQEIWKGLNTKIYSFYTGPLAKIKTQGAFNTREATSSNDNRVTVTANSGAPTGTHKLKIEQLAGAQFETSDQLGLDKNNKAVTGSTLLADLGMTADGTGVITVEAGTTTKTLRIDSSTTVADFVYTLKSAGLNASYDAAQKRFFISSKESGNANAFSISGNEAVDLSKLKLSTITRTTNADGSYTVAGGMNLVAPTDAKFE